MKPTLCSALLHNNDVRVDVPAEMLDSGSDVQVAEINVIRNGKTARFWVSVALTPAGRPVAVLVANGKQQRQASQVGTYLDLEARRIERQSAGKAYLHPHDLRDCGDKD